MRHLGVTLEDLGPGRCETSLALRPEHLQQNGFVHAGVQATMADHTAGAAAGTLMAADEIVLTVELKVQLLRPGRGERLRCRAGVLRPGRKVVATEADVFCVEAGAERLCAKLTATMYFAPE